MHTPLASLSTDVLTLTFNSLSKAYRSCGYRAGWMVISGDKRLAKDYIEGLNMLANMQACAPTCRGSGRCRRRWAATKASTTWFAKAGRLRRQRDLAYELINADSRRVAASSHKAALYMFPRLDPEMYPITGRPGSSSWKCCKTPRVMLVQGSGFN